MEVELAARLSARLGESPVWLEASRALVWVDIARGTVHRLAGGRSEVESIALDAAPSALAPRLRGGLVVAAKGGFLALDDDAWSAPAPPPPGRVKLPAIAPVEPGLRGRRMNDGKCDRRGRFWAG